MDSIYMLQALCSQCETKIHSESRFCGNCGFPEHGEEIEKAEYRAKKVMKENLVLYDQKRIKSARNTLYVIAGIFFIFGLFQFFTVQDSALLITNIIVASIYIVLAYWSQHKPFAALLSALLLYILIIVSNFIVEPTTFFKGILVKIIIISFLIKGLYSASKAVGES